MNASYDESAKRWSVTVNKNGTTRTIKSKQFVVATGLAGTPHLPHIEGADTFKGTIRHSAYHDSARNFKGKKVLVVGTSSSGFDSALDAARNGVEITMLQRSPTYVMRWVPTPQRLRSIMSIS
jgi:cation diffusion facilitator CzcD-associated flavoprotein CzcO